MKKIKKPFKETKFGKILTSPIVKTALEFIPFNLGSAASEMLSKTDTAEGTMSREKLVKHLVKIGIYAVLVYLVLSGKINWDDAANAKDFIGQ